MFDLLAIKFTNYQRINNRKIALLYYRKNTLLIRVLLVKTL
jgi:hypothetical protein